MKPFKTYEEQVDILKSRGLIVDENTIYDLQNENYYNVINGYKDLFLELKPDSKEPMIPEKFVDGASFEEIFALYKLDRRLRNTLLEYLLVFETHLKSRIAYFFSEKYKEPHSYLYFQNYTSNSDKTKSVVKTVAVLSNIMTKKNIEPMDHYIRNHKGVPFWILMNYLTVGNVSHLYEILDEEIKVKVASNYSEKFNRQYEMQVNIQSVDVESVLKQVNFFRNVCAHEERLYDFKLKKRVKSLNLISNYNDISNVNIVNDNLQSKLFDMILFLIFFLNRRDYSKLLEELDQHIDYYSKQMHTINKKHIYEKVGCLTNTFSDILNLKDL